MDDEVSALCAWGGRVGEHCRELTLEFCRDNRAEGGHPLSGTCETWMAPMFTLTQVSHVDNLRHARPLGKCTRRSLGTMNAFAHAR